MSTPLASPAVEPLDEMLRRLPTTEPLPQRVRAKHLQAGDVIVADGCISIRVTGIRGSVCGFVVIGYDLIGVDLGDERTMVADEIVTVHRPVAEAGH